MNREDWIIARGELERMRNTPAEIGAEWNTAHEAIFQKMADLIDIADQIIH